MDIVNLIDELQKFSKEVIQLNEPVNIDDVLIWESEQNINLPADYKTFITQYNGLTLMGTQVYGIKEADGKSISCVKTGGPRKTPIN